MQVKTITELKKIKPQDGQFVAVEDEGAEFIFRENRPDLTPDDDAIHASTIPGRENDRWEKEKAQGIAGGGGSGSPYPDKITVLTASRALTADDQGFVVIAAPGLTITLPDSGTAQVGWTYKIFDAVGSSEIDTNGAPIAGYTTGVFKPGVKFFTIVAGNMGSFAWLIGSKINLVSYDNSAIYTSRDIVLSNGNYYMCIQDNTAGVIPGTNQTNWRILGGTEEVTGSILLSDLAFTAGTAPTSLLAGGYKWTKTGKVYTLVIDLLFSGGVNVTETQITLAKASEIRDACFNAWATGPVEEDIMGIGHAWQGGFGDAVMATCMYSPTNMEYIRAVHAAKNLGAVQMRFVFGG